MMTEFDAVIGSGEGRGRENEAAAPETAERVRAGRSVTFGQVLILIIILTLIAGTYESLTQGYYPSFSLLAQAHRLGYMKGVALAYEPGKGIWHPLGWAGSAMMAVMMLYSLRKRFSFLSFLGPMRHWLSAHMFLGVMGPLLVTFHTTFKFHGLVATSFWCMVVTMLFGILGRYIYVQIPRSITGAELGVKDIERAVEGLDRKLGKYLRNANISSLLSELGVAGAEKIVRETDLMAAKYVKDTHISSLLKEIGSAPDVSGRNAASALLMMLASDVRNWFRIMRLKREIKARYRLSRYTREEVAGLLKKKAALIRRKNLLSSSHRLLHYWHVFHVPLAIVMFVIMFLHIAVYYIFRPGA